MTNVDPVPDDTIDKCDKKDRSSWGDYNILWAMMTKLTN